MINIFTKYCNRTYIATVIIWTAHKRLPQKYIFIPRDMSLCPCGSQSYQGRVHPVLFPPNWRAENISNIYETDLSV
jgi:hypothetical protein